LNYKRLFSIVELDLLFAKMKRYMTTMIVMEAAKLSVASTTAAVARLLSVKALVLPLVAVPPPLLELLLLLPLEMVFATLASTVGKGMLMFNTKLASISKLGVPSPDTASQP
jgi:hypothetical protein